MVWSECYAGASHRQRPQRTKVRVPLAETLPQVVHTPVNAVLIAIAVLRCCRSARQNGTGALWCSRQEDSLRHLLLGCLDDACSEQLKEDQFLSSLTLWTLTTSTMAAPGSSSSTATAEPDANRYHVKKKEAMANRLYNKVLCIPG